MKVIVTVRTRNEARNIGRFCLAYAWADAILIADGGSDDTTLDIARQFGNVKVDLFTQKVWQNDIWRNPYGRHINFLLDWALAEGADWIINDDCDCVPTVALQQDARGLMEDTAANVLELYRLYVWGHDEYFPRMNDPGQSLWAWRAGVPIRANEDDPWIHFMSGWNEALKLEPPLAALHYFCPDPDTTNEKLKFYRESGEQSGAVHPLESCGPLELLPDWAKWR